MLITVQLLLAGILILVLARAFVLVRRHLAQPRSGLKCETCRHCGLIDEDGVMCRYGGAVTLKTRVHVKNCMDHEPG